MADERAVRVEHDEIDEFEVAEYVGDIARQLAVLARSSGLTGVAEKLEQAERAAQAALYDLSRKAAPDDAA